MGVLLPGVFLHEQNFAKAHERAMVYNFKFHFGHAKETLSSD